MDSRCVNCRLSGHTSYRREECDDHESGYECFSCNKHVSKYCEVCGQSDCEDHDFPCVCTYNTEYCNICEEEFCASCVGKTEKGTVCVGCLVKAYNISIKDSIKTSCWDIALRTNQVWTCAISRYSLDVSKFKKTSDLRMHNKIVAQNTFLFRPFSFKTLYLCAR